MSHNRNNYFNSQHFKGKQEQIANQACDSYLQKSMPDYKRAKSNHNNDITFNGKLPSFGDFQYLDSGIGKFNFEHEINAVLSTSKFSIEPYSHRSLAESISSSVVDQYTTLLPASVGLVSSPAGLEGVVSSSSKISHALGLQSEAVILNTSEYKLTSSGVYLGKKPAEDTGAFRFLDNEGTLARSQKNPLKSPCNRIPLTQPSERVVSSKPHSTFLIKGATPEIRRAKFYELINGNSFHMYGSYEEGDELVVVFSENRAHFNGMTFTKAKEIAGTKTLESEFQTSGYGNEPRFGIIDLSTLNQNKVMTLIKNANETLRSLVQEALVHRIEHAVKGMGSKYIGPKLAFVEGAIAAEEYREQAIHEGISPGEALACAGVAAGTKTVVRVVGYSGLSGTMIGVTSGTGGLGLLGAATLWGTGAAVVEAGSHLSGEVTRQGCHAVVKALRKF